MNTSTGPVASAGASAPPPARPSSAGPQKIRRRNRKIASCLECRRRKLKCDHQNPCGNCAKNHRDCLFIAPAVDSESRRRLAAVKDQVQNLETGLGRAPPNQKPPVGLWQPSRHRHSHYRGPDGQDDFEDDSDSFSDEDGVHTNPSSLTVEDVAYEEDADDLLELGVQLGRMRVAERMGTFIRPRLVDEIGMMLRRAEEKGGSVATILPSADEADLTGNLPFYLQPSSEYIAPDSGFLFMPGQAHEATLAHCLPPKPVTDSLIAQYWTAVHPVARTVHRPSFERRYDIFWSDVATGTVPPFSLQALVFAALLSATTSLKDEEVRRSFRSSRSSFINNFRQAAEYALTKANVLRTTKLETIQALVTYLVPCCRQEVTRVHAVLVSSAIRIAECAGLHRDGTTYGLSPLEIHVRRMVWHQLCFLDMRTTDAVGPRPQIHAGEFDSRIPLNVNDEALENDGSPQEDAHDFTDMTHFCARAEWVDYYRYLWRNRLHKFGQPIRLTPTLRDIEEWRSRFEAKWIPLHDERIPRQAWSLKIIKFLILSLNLRVTAPFLSPSIIETPDRLATTIVHLLLLSVGEAIDLETAQRFQTWRWYVPTYQQYHAALLLLRELHEHPKRPEADVAWPSLDYVFDLPANLDRKEKARYVIGELFRRLQVFRVRRRLKSSVAVDREMERLSLSPHPSPQQSSGPGAPVHKIEEELNTRAASSLQAAPQTTSLPFGLMTVGGDGSAQPSPPANISMDIDWVRILVPVTDRARG